MQFLSTFYQFLKNGIGKLYQLVAHTCLLFFNYQAFSQITLKVTLLQPQPQMSIYAVGNFNNWNPKDENYKMKLQKDGSYQVKIKGLKKGEHLEYKFTRGDWSQEEVKTDGSVPSNHQLEIKKSQVIHHQIVNWKDMLQNHTIVGSVHILQTEFLMPQLGRKRRIWVYLPPDYELNLAKRYPVLYMHDGQNLFDNVFSAFGEWGIDEAMQTLFAAGYSPAIVVGIDNGGADRINEYAAWKHPTHGGGEGEKYMQFIIQTLKPHIDASYRTFSDRENTGLMGSSMGGLISMYGGIAHQEIFGKLGIFSPSFWFTPDCYHQIKETGKKANMKFYFMCGGQESQAMVGDVERMMDTLLSVGFSKEEIHKKVIPNGQHSEWLWRQEYPEAYQWLFGGSIENQAHHVENPFPFGLSASPVKDSLAISWQQESSTYTVSLYNTSGQNVFFSRYKGNQTIPLSQLSTGIYLLIVHYDGIEYRKKILKN
ncbi:MAG: alpha/beta hydrolase-fold protein [Bacteroidia bacterium]